MQKSVLHPWTKSQRDFNWTIITSRSDGNHTSVDYRNSNSHKEKNKNGYVSLDSFKELIKLDNSNVNVETYNRYTLVCKYFEEVKNLNTNE